MVAQKLDNTLIVNNRLVTLNTSNQNDELPLHAYRFDKYNTKELITFFCNFEKKLQEEDLYKEYIKTLKDTFGDLTSKLRELIKQKTLNNNALEVGIYTKLLARIEYKISKLSLNNFQQDQFILEVLVTLEYDEILKKVASYCEKNINVYVAAQNSIRKTLEDEINTYNASFTVAPKKAVEVLVNLGIALYILAGILAVSIDPLFLTLNFAAGLFFVMAYAFKDVANSVVFTLNAFDTEANSKLLELEEKFQCALIAEINPNLLDDNTKNGSIDSKISECGFFAKAIQKEETNSSLYPTMK